MLITLLVLAPLQPEPKPAESAPPPAAPAITPEVLWSVPTRSASFGSAAVADVNGDGRPDVAFACYFGDSTIRVLDGRNGEEIWSHDASKAVGGDACLDASCRLFDVDGDGKLELIVPVSNRSEVLCFDAAKGGLKWTYEAGLGECIDTPPLIQDLDGDGKVEIVVGTFKGALHIIDREGKRVARLPAAKGAVQSCPTFFPAGSAKKPALLAGNFGGDHAFHAVAYPGGEEVFRVQTGGHIYHGAAVADLNGDGRADLVGCSYDGKVYAFDADGKELWTVKPGDRYFMSPASIGDLDGDGKPEVIVASEKVTVLRADGTTVYSEPAAPKSQAWAVTRGVALADLDGDGKPDLAYTDGTGRLTVRRGFDGRPVAEFEGGSLLPKPPQTASHAPVIADFDGDGLLDVFYVAGHGDARGGSFGAAICLKGFNGKGPGWTTMRHDERNTGAAMGDRKP